MTICGQTFGEYGSQPTAYYRAVKCLTTAWKSSSSVVCQPIATSSWPTSATVRVSAVSSWSSADLSFDAPRPTNIYPRNLPRTLGGGVTIYGINFFADADPTASIGLWYSASGGGTGCLTASWTSERGPLFTNTSEHADGERRGRTPAPTNIAPRQAPVRSFTRSVVCQPVRQRACAREGYWHRSFVRYASCLAMLFVTVIGT